MDLIKVLKERANLFRVQVHPGSNIFDQAAGKMSELERENKKLTEELTFCENLLKMFGEIELAETEDTVEMYPTTNNIPVLSKERIS